jgi:hypothetical protein
VGVAGFDVLSQGEVMLDGAKADPPQKKNATRGTRKALVGIY